MPIPIENFADQVCAADNLSARRGSRTIFDRLSFALAGGDALMITGANGSGKSTLLGVLAGLLPYSGQLEILPRNEILYIGHLDALKPEFTITEQIAYWHALDPSLVTTHIQNTQGDWGLNIAPDTPVRRLSAGQKRRLSLLRLALKPARLWLLDEPATALDRAGLQKLETAVAEHRAKGGATIIATHQPLDIPNALALDMVPPAAHTILSAADAALLDF